MATNGINFPKYINDFRDLYTGYFHNSDYKIKEEHIKPYLDYAFKNNPTEEKHYRPLLTKLYISHRELLYLDQYVTYYKYVKQNVAANTTVFLNAYCKERYNVLDCLNMLLMIVEEQNDSYEDLVHIYEDLVYITLNEIYIPPTTENINNVSWISAHGGYDSQLCIVPDDVIILLRTPFNKYGITKQNDQDVADYYKTFEKLRGNKDFLRNPTCYLRTHLLYKNSVLYYPGQIINNWLISYTCEEENSIPSFGYFTTKRHKLNDILDSDKLNSLKTIFADPAKLSKIRGNIIIISGCRGMDYQTATVKEIEIIYRTEFITHVLNSSTCMSYPLINYGQNNKYIQHNYLRWHSSIPLASLNNTNPYNNTEIVLDPILSVRGTSQINTIKKHHIKETNNNFNNYIKRITQKNIPKIKTATRLESIIHAKRDIIINKLREIFNSAKFSKISIKKIMSIFDNNLFPYVTSDSIPGMQISDDMMYTVNITRYMEIINHVIKNIQYFTLPENNNNAFNQNQVISKLLVSAYKSVLDRLNNTQFNGKPNIIANGVLAVIQSIQTLDKSSVSMHFILFLTVLKFIRRYGKNNPKYIKELLKSVLNFIISDYSKYINLVTTKNNTQIVGMLYVNTYIMNEILNKYQALNLLTTAELQDVIHMLDTYNRHPVTNKSTVYSRYIYKDLIPTINSLL